MITLKKGGHILKGGLPVPAEGVANPRAERNKTMAYKVMNAHNSSSDESLMRIKFDSLISHDITYVGIIQTARGSGLREFPVPYVYIKTFHLKF